MAAPETRSSHVNVLRLRSLKSEKLRERYPGRERNESFNDSCVHLLNFVVMRNVIFIKILFSIKQKVKINNIQKSDSNK